MYLLTYHLRGDMGGSFKNFETSVNEFYGALALIQILRPYLESFESYEYFQKLGMDRWRNRQINNKTLEVGAQLKIRHLYNCH